MPQFTSVADLVADARSRLKRVEVSELPQEIACGARLVDIRPAWQRAREGEIAGSLIVERNHLEWRLHVGSGSELAQARTTSRWIVVCSEGYTSSLAADALRSLGVDATDLVGGVRAWREAGLHLQPGPTTVDTVVCAREAGAVPDRASEDLGQLGGPDIEGKPPH